MTLIPTFKPGDADVPDGYTSNMDAVSDAIVLAEPIEELEARIAKLVVDVDALAAILPKAVARCRLETVRIMAKDVTEQSQAVTLSIRLNRPPVEVLETVETLRASLSRLRLMSSRIRVEQGTLLSILLMERLTASLSVDLVAWRASLEARGAWQT